MALVSHNEEGFVFQVTPKHTVEVKLNEGEWFLKFGTDQSFVRLDNQEVSFLKNFQQNVFSVFHEATIIRDFYYALQNFLNKIQPGLGRRSVATPKRIDFADGNVFASEMEKPDYAVSLKSAEERRSLMTEECSEVIQALQKINRFKSKNGHWDNIAALEKECGDLLAALSLMSIMRDIKLSSVLKAGKEKLEKFKNDSSLLLYQDSYLLDRLELVVADAASVRPMGDMFQMQIDPPPPVLEEVSYGTFKIQMFGRIWKVAFTDKEGKVSEWQRLQNIAWHELVILVKATERSTVKYPPSFCKAVDAQARKRFK